MACNRADVKGTVVKGTMRNAAVLTLLAAVGLAGCSGSEDTASTVPAPPPARPAPATPAKPAVKAAPPAGFTPLATPQQVVNAIEVGRPDPFAPSQAPVSAAGPSAGASAAKATLPDGFRLTGVIRSGGSSQAFVQIGDQSGPLCPGPRGRCTGAAEGQPLLPPGWSVTGIDAAKGLMAVSFGRQRQVISVAP